MELKNKSFEIKKTFGMGVLMKLTKKNVSGIEISTIGDRFISNVSRNEMADAVDFTIKSHNIKLKV